jgi:hypothetical protein
MERDKMQAGTDSQPQVFIFIRGTFYLFLARFVLDKQHSLIAISLNKQPKPVIHINLSTN